MKWFRFYSEFRSDTKIKRLPVHHRYAFVILLCLANECENRGFITHLDDEDIAFELEMEAGDWQTLKAKFRVKGFIEVIEGGIKISNWEKRQRPDNERLPAAAWRIIRERIFRRDDYTCQYCGAKGVQLQCDHVIPISRGGGNDDANLVTACKPCNQSKHNKTPEEWRAGNDHMA